jgi:hypothetical protein
MVMGSTLPVSARCCECSLLWLCVLLRQHACMQASILIFPFCRSVGEGPVSGCFFWASCWPNVSCCGLTVCAPCAAAGYAAIRAWLWA